MTRRPSWPVAPVTTIMCLLLFDNVVTTIVRPTDRQQTLGRSWSKRRRLAIRFALERHVAIASFFKPHISTLARYISDGTPLLAFKFAGYDQDWRPGDEDQDIQ